MIISKIIPHTQQLNLIYYIIYYIRYFFRFLDLVKHVEKTMFFPTSNFDKHINMINLSYPNRTLKDFRFFYLRD